MKRHNIIKVVLVSLVFILLLSWILPAGYYSGEYVDQGRVQMGLAELFNYPLTAISYFGHIVLFIILIGCFYGVLYKIPAYRTFLERIAAKFERKEIVFIALTVILLALGVSVAGLQTAFMFFVPLIASIIVLMGYDKVVAAMTIVGGMGAGLIGTTYAYSNSSLLLQILNLKNDYQIGVRFLILAVAVVLVIFNIAMFIKKGKNKDVVVLNSTKEETKEEKVAEKVVEEKTDKEEKEVKEKKTTSAKSTSKNSNKKKGKSNSSKKTTSKAGTNKSSRSKNPNKAAMMKDDIIVIKESVSGSSDDSHLVPDRVDVSTKVWPFTIGFMLMLILVVLAFITWGESGFGISLFNDVTDSVTNFELFGFPIFSKIYGTLNPFGNWNIMDLFFPMFLLLLLFIVIYKVKMEDVFDGFEMGAKKALGPAFVALIVYTILVTVTFHPFQLAIYKAVLGLVKGYNVFTTSLVALLSGIFNVDPAYVFQGAVPYFTSIVKSANDYANAGVVFQSMYGFTSLFAPTSFVLMCVLSYLNVNYKDWFKATWKLLLELLVILLIVFVILTL